MKTRSFAVIVLSLLLAGAVVAQTRPASAANANVPVVLKGGKLLTITHGTIENGVLVMQDGKLTAVGAANAVAIPRNARVIDVSGMTVYPGLIDSETHLGLTEISADRMTNDEVEPSDEIDPQLHTWEAFHGESELIPVTRANGILNAVVAPSERDTLPGQDSFIQLDGKSASEMLLVKDIALPLNFTGRQRRNESFQSAKYPMTRMGMAAQLRQAFVDAQDYAQRLSDYEKKKGGAPASDEKGPLGPPKRDLKAEALQPYLQGKKPVVISAEEASDVQTALALAREFNLKIVLDHVTYAQPVLDLVAAAKAPVIVSIYDDPKEDERYDTIYRLPAELYKRGVKIAFASYDAHQSRNLPYAAGYAVAFGLPYDEALKAVTLNAAEIWGMADKLGSLDMGKVANVVVANGDPLDMKTDIKRVFIAGREAPLTNRQTQLRDEYSK